jgi:hypothetical protein
VLAALLAVGLAAAGPAQPGGDLSPPEAARLAHADARALPAGVAARSRWLWLGHRPVEDRALAFQVLSGHLNGLSRTSAPRAPTVVPLSAGALVRLHLDDYGWDDAAWERLAGQDPYFRQAVEEVVDWPGGVWPGDGKHYGRGAFPWQKRVVRDGFWLAEGEADAARLVELRALSHSEAPLAHAGWLLAETAAQDGRAVGYYDMLGVKSQADWERLVRFDAGLATDLERNRVLAFSGITLQPRRVEQTRTTLGVLWRTFDQKKGVDRNNPLRLLDNDFRFAATEQFAPLPNGLPTWLLADDKGRLQAKAPDDVVRGDHTDPLEGRLHVGISCWRCHFLGEAEDGFKELAALKPGRLYAADHAKLVELERRYKTDLTRAVRETRQLYREAIAEATAGLKPAAFVKAYGRDYAEHVHARMDLARAARELGVAAVTLRAACAKLDAAGQLDPVLSILLDGGAVGRVQFEEVIPQAHAALKGVVLPP